MAYKYDSLVEQFNRVCAYQGCDKKATGKCCGSQRWNWTPGEASFYDDCGKYFCPDHLHWGRGDFLVNCCVATKQCPDHIENTCLCTIL